MLQSMFCNHILFNKTLFLIKFNTHHNFLDPLKKKDKREVSLLITEHVENTSKIGLNEIIVQLLKKIPVIFKYTFSETGLIAGPSFLSATSSH